MVKTFYCQGGLNYDKMNLGSKNDAIFSEDAY